jgi:nucleotide-binding universal stress UspA family protein
MYHSLLVPLDQSPFAKDALPLALSIARRSGARLDLVEVHTLYALGDPTSGRVPFESERDVECRQQEQHYLDATAESVATTLQVPVTTAVLPGSAVLPATIADAIVERARISKSNLIVMTTRGRRPVSRFVLGSVADELLHRASVPILMMRPCPIGRETDDNPILDNILIPLDGSALAEQVLEPAQELARIMNARCCLLRVVDTRSFAYGWEAGGKPETTRAETYLQCVAGKLREQGLRVETRVVVSRHAPEAILEEAEGQECNLIAIATHGRGGLARLLMGSVADRLIQGAACPVLVCCPVAKGHGPG